LHYFAYEYEYENQLITTRANVKSAVLQEEGKERSLEWVLDDDGVRY
jgi:hypothetical protein